MSQRNFISGVVPLVVMSKFMIEEGMRRVMDGAHAEGIDLLNGAIGRLREVLDDVRRISTELRPSLLDDLGLLPTVEWLCRTFEQTYRTVRVERQISVTEMEVPQHLKLVIFRTIEELLATWPSTPMPRTYRLCWCVKANELCLDRRRTMGMVSTPRC